MYDEAKITNVLLHGQSIGENKHSPRALQICWTKKKRAILCKLCGVCVPSSLELAVVLPFQMSVQINVRADTTTWVGQQQQQPYQEYLSVDLNFKLCKNIILSFVSYRFRRIHYMHVGFAIRAMLVWSKIR